MSHCGIAQDLEYIWQWSAHQNKQHTCALVVQDNQFFTYGKAKNNTPPTSSMIVAAM